MGMLVKKCFVTDGDGEDHAVIDFDGYGISPTVPRLPYTFRCTTDPFLLSQLTYDNNLMRAHATSQVFKYADSNQLYFTCQIRLCQKQMGLCADITVRLIKLRPVDFRGRDTPKVGRNIRVFPD